MSFMDISRFISPAPLTYKGISKSKILLVKTFSLKQNKNKSKTKNKKRTNQIFPATQKINQAFSLQENSIFPRTINFVEICNDTFK